MEMCFTWGGLVKVKFLNQELVLPVVPTYAYVDSGKAAIITGRTDTGAPTGYLSFAINMGNFAETYGIATKQTDEDGNWWWTAHDGVTFPMEISFELTEAAEYIKTIGLTDAEISALRTDLSENASSESEQVSFTVSSTL